MRRPHLMATTIILDGNALVVRSLWGGVRDEIKNGLPFTSGIHGSINTLARIVQHHEVRARRIIAFFDHTPPLRRVRLLPDYKRGRRQHWIDEYRTRLKLPREREDEDDDLGIFESVEQRVAALAQVRQVYALLPLLGITTLCYREREADDGVAAAVQVIAAEGGAPLVVTGDHDLWQCVAMGARVWDLANPRIIHAGNFVMHAKTATDTYVLFRALVGDASDRIVGVHGLGPVLTSKLLSDAGWDVRLVNGPRAQLRSLCRYLKRKRKRSTAESRLIEERERIDRVIRAIDLRTSFGPLDGLTRRLAEPTEIQSQAFLRACRELGVLRSTGPLLNVFQRVARRGRA